MLRDLSVSFLATESELEDDPYAECPCGTNCSVCSGTGSKGCEKHIGEDEFTRLREMLSHV